MTTSTVWAVAALGVWLSVAGPAGAANQSAKRVEWVAHRGESHDAPENTMASFKLAWARGDDAVEFDVHLTKDGRLAVSHDPNLKRLTGQDVAIVNTTLDELRKADLGKWKGPQFAGERIPTLEDVLSTIPADPHRRLFCEIKVGPEAVPAFVEAYRKSGKPANQVAVISFKADTLAEVKKQLPELKTYYLSDFKQDKQTKQWSPTVEEILATAKRIKADGVDLSYKAPFDAALVKAARSAGMAVYAWTVDDPAAARRLIDLGVDGITTNRGQWLRQQVEGGAAKATTPSAQRD
jgi:glycerophosphoryl diester phosphodiesterase